MARLILIGQSGYNPSLLRGPDCVIPFTFRFIWRKLPSPSELDSYLGARTEGQQWATHWSDWVGRWRSAEKAAAVSA